MSVCKLAARSAVRSVFLVLLGCSVFPSLTSESAAAKILGKSQDSEHTLIMQLEAPEADALQAVQAVVNDQIIHGTQQYAKEKILFGAHAAESSRALAAPETGGKVFYKVAEKILAPQNFHESESIGTITVRYIVQKVNDTTSMVQIDAIFVEDDRRRVHRSDGVVESAEYGEIQRKLQELQAERNKPAEPAVAPAQVESVDASSLDSFTGLEQRLNQLRHQVELRTKENTTLKSAPYHSAASIQSLTSGTELLVMVVTPYWHRGWVHRTEVESLP
jgi:hypothetical protein